MQIHSVFRKVIPILLLTTMAFCAEASSIYELRYEPVDETRERTIPIKVYLTKSEEPQPVVLFSHGLGGSRENNEYLGKHWAASGYIAVFMQHPGSDTKMWKSVRSGERLTALKSAVSVESASQRFGDIPFVIDQLEAWNRLDGHELNELLDLEHIGMSGHSYGAATTLAVAGRKYPFNRNFSDERIDAFLALSPQPGKGIEVSKAFGHLTKPTLCMTGTMDYSPINPNLGPSARRKVFAALPAGNKYQLVLEGADHFAFGDSQRPGISPRNPKHHPVIQQISLQFWNAYLKDDAGALQWLKSQQPITETGLSHADIWEWK